ncbi:MAG: cupin fold metalloprotein, WbuC family [Planctomycetes bacterium]|nr:cupin fold metalloprotein, WbuC family [Planctomycetota bacterium]
MRELYAIVADAGKVAVGRDLVEMVKTRARGAPLRRFRDCLHRTTDDPLQEMVICVTRGSYFPPHRHPKAKSESYHMIEGRDPSRHGPRHGGLFPGPEGTVPPRDRTGHTASGSHGGAAPAPDAAAGGQARPPRP